MENNTSTTAQIITEVVWIVGTVAVSYAAVWTMKKAWKTGVALKNSKLSKVKP